MAEGKTLNTFNDDGAQIDTFLRLRTFPVGIKMLRSHGRTPARIRLSCLNINWKRAMLISQERWEWRLTSNNRLLLSIGAVSKSVISNLRPDRRTCPKNRTHSDCSTNVILISILNNVHLNLINYSTYFSTVTYNLFLAEAPQRDAGIILVDY